MDGGAHDRIECALGDLTRERVDAVVNAANRALRGGGGVDGAIHRAAGPALLEELRRRYPDGCATGEVRATAGHGLPARHVFHAVGPRWRGGRSGEARALESCYRGALELADRHAVRTLACPAISCGVYGYPWEPAARIAVETVARGLASRPGLERVRFVLFEPDLFALFQRTLTELRGGL